MEKRELQGETVHVQTARTDSRSLAGVDQTKLAKLRELQQNFVAVVGQYGGDTSKAAKVCEFKPASGDVNRTNLALDDFNRDIENRAIKVITAGGFQKAVQDDMRKVAIAFALKRRTSLGSPGDFANAYEYFASHWRERYEEEMERQGAEVRDGTRRTTDRSEAAWLAAAAVSSGSNKIERKLYRDRRTVENQGREGATAGPELSDEELVGRVRSQAAQIRFSTSTAAAYHARKHGSEIPPDQRVGRTQIAFYHHAATQAVINGTVTVRAMGSGTRQLVFAHEVVDPSGASVKLSAMVFARHDGRVVMATFGSFLK